MIRLTHEDGSLFLVNDLQIENIVDTVNGTMIQIIGKPNSCFIVKETIDEIENMILRDQFAMSAMSGLQGVYWDDVDGYDSAEHLVKCMAESSYQIADAMLKQRKEK